MMTYLYLQLAQFTIWISMWLITHLTAVADIVPVWFATGAVAISSLISVIDIFWPMDVTIIPALAATFLIDGALLILVAFNFGIRKIPGVS
jgi:hypothetical protein